MIDFLSQPIFSILSYVSMGVSLFLIGRWTVKQKLERTIRTWMGQNPPSEKRCGHRLAWLIAREVL